MSGKPSRWRQFMQWLAEKGKEGSDEVKVEGLPEYAVKVVMDKKLRERIDEYQMLLELLNQPIEAETLYQYIDELTDMVKTTHSCVLRIGGVYARAGDEVRGAKMMRGWDRLHSIYWDHCICVRIFWGSDESLKDGKVSISEIHVQNLHVALINFYFRRAFDVLNYCFRNQDVRPFSVTMIQSMMPMMGGEGGTTLTGSGGATSEERMIKPERKAYKRGQPNTT